jgi:hypothetical protein
MKPIVIIILLLAVLLSCHGHASAQQKPAASAGKGIHLPSGYQIPEFTVSPNGMYGVSVQVDFLEAKDSNAGESLADAIFNLKTGRVIGPLLSKPCPLTANHLGVDTPRWSPDSTLMLWHAHAKWSAYAIELVKFDGDKILWQLDLLKAAQKAILDRTRAAAPESYRQKKEENKGNGSAYPEGFTIDVTTPGEDTPDVTLPLKVHASLTSDPKDISPSANLESELEGIVDSGGKFTVTHFKLLQKGRPLER